MSAKRNSAQTMKEIWVFIDARNERHLSLSINLLAKARELAAAVAGRTAALVIGAGAAGKKTRGAHAIPERCIAGGADIVYLFNDPLLAVPRSDVYAPVIADAVESRGPMMVLFALTDFGRDLAARTARRCNAGLIADCVDLALLDGRVVASCPSWGGEILARITYTDGFAATGFATVQAHGIKPVSTRGRPGAIVPLPLSDIEIPTNVKLVSSSIDAGARKKLEEADVVVTGGAGMGSAEGFALVRDLASALGGEVGATRQPVLQHWADEECMIGQTGKTVRPQLLVSAGTSGAIQFTAGIMEAGTIVAINRDADAPIFQTADIGIVADAKTFLPHLTSKIRQVMMRTLTDSLHEKKGGKAKKVSGFGEKLRKLRESHKWTVEKLAQTTGQSPEAITKFERDEDSPSVSFLLRLSRALNVDAATFLRETEKAAIRDSRTKAFATRTQNYSYRTLTPGAENEHLRSFMVTIEPRQLHKPVAYKHEGEEFIYVMEGDLELTLDNKVHKLRPHESIHFNSETPHKLKSISDEPTRCLVILYTP